MFVKYSDTATLEEVVSKFISSEPSLSGSADDQKRKIIDNLKRMKVSLSSVRSLTLDSCKTNMGNVNGLVMQIAREIEQLVIVVGCDLHILQFMLTNGINASFRDKSSTTDELHCLQAVYKAAYLLGLNWKEHSGYMHVFFTQQSEEWQRNNPCPTEKIQLPVTTRWWTTLDAVKFVLKYETFIVAYAKWLITQVYDSKQATWTDIWRLVALNLCHPLVRAQLVFLNEYGDVFHTPEFAWSQKTAFRACEMPHRIVKRAQFLNELSTLPGLYAKFPLTGAAAQELNAKDKPRFEKELSSFVLAVRKSLALHGYRWLRAPLCLAALGHEDNEAAVPFAKDVMELARSDSVQQAADQVPIVVPPLPDHTKPFYAEIWERQAKRARPAKS
jgi:hypothetical protein